MTEANDERYSFTVTYNWGEPDMEELNKRIDERENQLKKSWVMITKNLQEGYCWNTNYD